MMVWIVSMVFDANAQDMLRCNDDVISVALDDDVISVTLESCG